MRRSLGEMGESQQEGGEGLHGVPARCGGVGLDDF